MFPGALLGRFGASRSPPEVPLGGPRGPHDGPKRALGGPLGGLETTPEMCNGRCTSLGASWGSLWALLGPSQAFPRGPPGPFWGLSEPSWGSLGGPRGPHDGPKRAPGGPLGGLKTTPEMCNGRCTSLGGSWGSLWALLGPSQAPPRGPPGRFGASRSAPEVPLGGPKTTPEMCNGRCTSLGASWGSLWALLGPSQAFPRGPPGPFWESNNVSLVLL